MDLALVMPAYNEEGCIRDVVSAWSATLATVTPNSRLFIVNDGSRDRTGAILDELAATDPRVTVIHQENGGHGKALRRAYEAAVAAGAAYVFHVDSDNQFVTDDFRRLWEHRTESLFLTGRRGERHDAPHRLVITTILRFFNLLVFGTFIPDANIPFRLIHGRYLGLLLELVPPSVFAPNIFLAVLAARDGQNLFQLPVTHKDRTTGKVSIVRWRLIKACLRCVRELAEFRAGLSNSLAQLRDRRATLGL